MTDKIGLTSEGQFLWAPSRARVDSAQLTKFCTWLRDKRNLTFSNYQLLWHWSVTDLEAFWSAIWDYFEIMSDQPYERVVNGNEMFKASWFEGTRTNYAEHLLRHEKTAGMDEVALCFASERKSLATMTWQELGSRVRVLATKLREIGVKRGDRVVSYMPNTPETAVAMLAVTSIAAVWSSASPEFGARSVIERFGQIAPKVMFAADGYSFNGKAFDRRREITEIAAGLPSLETIVLHSYMGLEPVLSTITSVVAYEDIFSGGRVMRNEFEFERVPSDFPLWVLFSSGTTGLPKAIVHSHVGMIAEHLKVMVLHMDLGPGKRMFFYTTTGWMVWNSVMAALISGASAVLYDGSPSYGGVDMLWRLASESCTTSFGASPTLVQHMRAAGLRPGTLFDLSALDSVTLAGAPSTPETFAWFYENVKADLWVGSQSGGTDLCSGLVVGAVTQPVYAGEIQVKALGIGASVWNEAGEEIVDEIGELVVTSPFPSAPLGFWGDENATRYFDTYYSTFPGIWRHGDLAKINGRGGAYVYGRSDATLNRFGVRIGTAEIYRVLETIPEISDSLVVCCETTGGGFYMPMFVVLKSGIEFTDQLRSTISTKLRQDASPRHVPDEIHQAPGILYTMTGKKMEVPVRKLLQGLAPEKVASPDAMADPNLLEWYCKFAKCLDRSSFAKATREPNDADDKSNSVREV